MFITMNVNYGPFKRGFKYKVIGYGYDWTLVCHNGKNYYLNNNFVTDFVENAKFEREYDDYEVELEDNIIFQ